jgi:glutaredoxin
MKVEIYTKAHCPYCERAKELLRIKEVAFIEYVINGNQQLVEESGRLDRLLSATPEAPR